MSGYATKAELIDVIKQTITTDWNQLGLSTNPADFNMSGILRDGFYYDSMYGWRSESVHLDELLVKHYKGEGKGVRATGNRVIPVDTYHEGEWALVSGEASGWYALTKDGQRVGQVTKSGEGEWAYGLTEFDDVWGRSVIPVSTRKQAAASAVHTYVRRSEQAATEAAVAEIVAADAGLPMADRVANANARGEEHGHSLRCMAAPFQPDCAADCYVAWTREMGEWVRDHEETDTDEAEVTPAEDESEAEPLSVAAEITPAEVTPATTGNKANKRATNRALAAALRAAGFKPTGDTWEQAKAGTLHGFTNPALVTV